MGHMMQTTLGDLIAAIYDAVSDTYGASPYTAMCTTVLLGQLLMEVVPPEAKARYRV